MPDCTERLPLPPHHAHPAAWQARLTLGFTRDSDTTRLTRREHSGPLRVQKPLYPEHPSVCHAIVVHPPGGVVGGDELSVTAHLKQDTHALLTSPGAAKWYRANGRVSRQRIDLAVDGGASLEWLPQETIFFNDAHVELDHHVALAADASYIGCEILCLGRRASGESFGQGRVAQRTSVRRGGRLLWWEQGALTPGTLASPLGLQGHTVSAMLLAVGKPVTADTVAALRALADHPCWGVTQMKHVLCVRWLGHDSEAARELMLAAWRIVRPAVLGRAAIDLRSWRT
ncbi:urease accessory protein UreD [Pseudoduganella albidiflava]|uniref:Urease accessory protein UreD n=1 Tax=Pseudoduganella albidiflava TaxID=321983 RepID=A0A411WZI8_9BURK|nr:urease accessory protein UreD [Pseudoduganella albidiflava]QBI02134.1 urease accessory protein UreD [Pseudoduganella albidiflava]GGY60253.1 urease accessory protein UreD 2 [Pseudoduganella albidiflava]